MKIVVSARGGAPEIEVDPQFGRAACFLVFDTESAVWQAVSNPQALPAARGAVIHFAETVCEIGADAVIGGHVGPKALTVLAAGGRQGIPWQCEDRKGSRGGIPAWPVAATERFEWTGLQSAVQVQRQLG
jgi:predicted Fe-Mo cluster-binding NifX family protein